MDAYSPNSLNTNGIMVGHGCSSHRILLEHERNYGLGMDALVPAFSWNINGIMVWAWMLTVFSWNTNGIMVWAWML